MKFLLALLIALMSSAAVADDAPRKIDFSQVLLDPDGKPLTECVKSDPVDRTKCLEEKTMTLGWASMQALNVPEQNMVYTEATKRGDLGLKVYQSHGVVLTSDEITLIKTQLAKRYSPLVVARAVPLLDPASK